MNNPEFEMLSAYPGLESLYGILVGFAYSVPESICGLLITLLPKGFNRKLTLGAVTLVAGLSMGLTGAVNSLGVLALMRVLHASCFSWVNTLVFSLSAEYFPRNKRATANAFLQSAQVFGIALSSLSIIIIERFGWRKLYSFMGALGLGIGTFMILFVKEPCCEEIETEKMEEKVKVKKEEESSQEKSNLLQKFSSALNVLTKRDITRNITFAGFSRKFADMILGSYAPFFFMLKYPLNKATFALLNAVSLATLGFCSNIMNGVIGDRYADRIPGIKAYMCSFTALVSAIVTTICFIAPGGFWMSFICYSLHILFSAGYQTLAFTMIQNSVEEEDIPKAISSYNLFTNLAQTIAPILFGFLATGLKAK